ncbi:hypothetical protein [Neokomagataea thailandica]|uniref:Uncharacterized protein n=1 Tax=Neokomagataea tanensis NBRC 106556 TaxID=1223519 RepID=A0ABQ0QHJ1_9PROT|nr:MULTISPECIES: hypothetical protein [Neokomagataea]GBR45039.1 hypothetical protein AA106556_0631 [Neokomagataea tanensis NBRC 106556]
MTKLFNVGASLPEPKPRPYEIEERHRFSPDESDFDRIKNHPRLMFSCDPEYQKMIDEAVWLNLMDGSPMYLK